MYDRLNMLLWIRNNSGRHYSNNYVKLLDKTLIQFVAIAYLVTGLKILTNNKLLV